MLPGVIEYGGAPGCAGLAGRRALLGAFVESIHYIESDLPEIRERILPGGRVHLMVNLYENEFRTYHGGEVMRTPGAVLEGAHARPVVIDTREQRCLVCVNFRLGGAARFFRMPLGEARDALLGLDQLWGRDGAVLRERLLEASGPAAALCIMEDTLLRRLNGPQSPDPAIRFAGRALACGARVADITEQLGLLPKTFVRRFESQVGLTPKRFARVRRLQRMLRSLGDPAAADWASVAAAHGYADQSHLIHDFRELTGMTPAAYRPRAPGEHNHVPLV